MKHTVLAISLAILSAASTFSRTGNDDAVQARGELVPWMQIDVKPEATGRVKKLYVQNGDRVKAGDLLAEIEPENAEKDSSKAKVRAGKDGLIVSLPVIERQQVISPGVYDGAVNNGTTLMTIADVSKLEVLAHIREADAAKLAVGQVAQVTAQSIRNEKIEAVISLIPPRTTIHNSVKGFMVKAV